MKLMVQGAPVYLVDEGSGPPVLFLHGNPDTSDVWHEQIRHLSPQYRCLAPDLPGFGRSLAPAGFDYSLDSLSAYVDDLLAALKIDEPVHLVVHDLGGPMGLAWAVQHPDRVRSLVVINTVFFSDYRWHFWARIWRTPLLGELSMKIMNRWAFRLELKRGSRKLTQEQMDQTYDLFTPEMRRMVLRFYRALTPSKLKHWEEALPNLTSRVPVLALWGDQDPYLPKQFARRFGAKQVVHFPDCGHWLSVEAAADVSGQMEAFFADQTT